MEEPLPPNPLCKQQRLASSPVQTKPDASSLNSMLRCQALRLTLDARFLTFCCVQRHYSQTLRLHHSVYWPVRIFSSKKKEDSIPRILQVIQQTGAPLQTLLNIFSTFQGFPENFSNFYHASFLTSLHSVEIGIFFFCTSLVLVWHGRFQSFLWLLSLSPEVFLIEEDHLEFLRPSNDVPPEGGCIRCTGENRTLPRGYL